MATVAPVMVKVQTGSREPVHGPAVHPVNAPPVAVAVSVTKRGDTSMRTKDIGFSLPETAGSLPGFDDGRVTACRVCQAGVEVTSNGAFIVPTLATGLSADAGSRRPAW